MRKIVSVNQIVIQIRMPKDTNTKLADSVMAAVAKLTVSHPSADAVRRLNELLYKSEFNAVLPIEARDVDEDAELKPLFKGLILMCHSKERLTKIEIMAIWGAVLGQSPKEKKPKEKKPRRKKPAAKDESSSESSSDSSSDDSDSSSDDEGPVMHKCHECPRGCKSHHTKDCPYRKGSTRGKKRVGK